MPTKSKLLSLLMLQRLVDKLVPPSQAEAMAKIMEVNGADGKTFFFEVEGHGFKKPSSTKRALEEEAWYKSLLVVE